MSTAMKASRSSRTPTIHQGMMSRQAMPSSVLMM